MLVTSLPASRTQASSQPVLHRDLPPDIFVGRQAILDDAERVWAYEVRYGQVGAQLANTESGDAHTLAHVLTAVIEAGTTRAVGHHPVLVYCPAAAITEELPPLIAKDRLVLQLPADLEVSPAIDAVLRGLRQQGVRFAVRWHHAPIADGLLEHLSVARFDVSAIYNDTLRDRVDEMKARGILLAADGVHDWDDQRRAVELGFDFFQGEFLCAPQTLQARRPPSNHIATLALLSELQRADASLSDLEQHLQRDAGLSFRLLRCLGTAASARATPITSVKHAMLMLGLDHLRRLITVLTLSSMGSKPPELLNLAITRAALCQQLAVKSRHADPSTAYTVGLFSVLDALLDWPMESIVAELPVAAEITRALLDHEGAAGDVLRCALGYEAGLCRDAALIGLSVTDLSSAFLTAISWADATRAELGDI